MTLTVFNDSQPHLVRWWLQIGEDHGWDPVHWDSVLRDEVVGSLQHNISCQKLNKLNMFINGTFWNKCSYPRPVHNCQPTSNVTLVHKHCPYPVTPLHLWTGWRWSLRVNNSTICEQEWQLFKNVTFVNVTQAKKSMVLYWISYALCSVQSLSTQTDSI